jgi:predicted F0F1-ATPase subunit
MSGPREQDEYVEAVRRKAERMERARRERRSLWTTLYQAGALGWVFVLPVVLGAGLGRLIAQHTGRPAATLVGLGLGLLMGGWSAWRNIQRSMDDGEAP